MLHLHKRLASRANAVLLTAAVGLICAGCGGGRETATNSAAAIGVSGRQIGNLSTPGTPKGQQTVKIEVIAKTGAQRAAVALVPIYIDGHGPYPFALDTGASRSLISSALARELHLPEEGSAGVVSGITGSSHAVNIRLDNWSAGKIPLPPTLIAAIVPSTTAHSQTQRGHPIGLLGSDVLSRYGKIAVDYDKSLLILDPPIR